MKKPFVHLHVHTRYSWDGACTCREIAEQTRKLGMDSVAITDHGHMHGVIEFFDKCKINGVKPIIGCEFYVDTKSVPSTLNDGHFNMIFLAENETGYRNLISLASSATAKDPFKTPSVNFCEILKFAKGLIGISSSINAEMPSAALNAEAIDMILRYKELLGMHNYFLELRPSRDPLLVSANRKIVEISRKYGIPLVAANNVHYLRPEDAALYHILLCDRRNITLKEMYKGRINNDGDYLSPPEEMWNMLGAELPDSLLNTVRIGERCNVDIQSNSNTPLKYQLYENETDHRSLCRIAEEGLKKRLKTKEPPKAYSERLHYELSAVDQAGFSGYFCIVADMMDAAHNMSVQTGPGRGYLASSLILWSLGITDIDPLKYGLLFELFLDAKRIGLPNVGIEVSERGRECILSYLNHKFGLERTARIIAFENISKEQSVAVVGRAMGMTAIHVDRVTRLINDESNPDAMYSILEQVDIEPLLKALYWSDKETKILLDMANRIKEVIPLCFEDPSGIAITPGPVSETVPVRRFSGQRILTQYERYHLEELGIPMVDFHGSKELSVLEETLSAIKTNGKDTVDLDRIPLDDPKAFELILSGNTNGVIPVDEAFNAMEDIVKRMKPDKLEDLMPLYVLCRPSSLKSGLTDKYLLNKHNKRPADNIHKSVTDATQETYGVFLYHEQMVQSISAITGCSIEEANRIRKRMPKHQYSIKIDEDREKFISDSSRNGIPSEDAADLFGTFTTHVGFTSPKAHCAGFALSIYRSAWLKANYPDEFLAAYHSRSIFNRGLISTS